MMADPCAQLRLVLVAFTSIVLSVLVCETARADDVRPAYLDLDEFEPGAFRVVWKVPVNLDVPPRFGPSFPESFRAIAPKERVDTPNARTVEEVTAFLDVRADQLVKTLLYVADGKTLNYIGCRVLYPGSVFELGGTRYNDYSNLMSGNDDIFLMRGTLAAYTYVGGVNNNLHGNSDISGKIILLNGDAELSIDINGMITNDIMLNGGKVTLGHDAVFTQGFSISKPSSTLIRLMWAGDT